MPTLASAMLYVNNIHVYRSLNCLLVFVSVVDSSSLPSAVSKQLYKPRWMLSNRLLFAGYAYTFSYFVFQTGSYLCQVLILTPSRFVHTGWIALRCVALRCRNATRPEWTLPSDSAYLISALAVSIS